MSKCAIIHGHTILYARSDPMAASKKPNEIHNHGILNISAYKSSNDYLMNIPK